MIVKKYFAAMSFVGTVQARKNERKGDNNDDDKLFSVVPLLIIYISFCVMSYFLVNVSNGR